ncbi:MAG: carboxypeptidase-like regulatory domain-containing protein, partial [Cytophagales bacterium]|nr:carboxypeptidase-like regulatory domain-containing protein [Cytophagales bacterium]
MPKLLPFLLLLGSAFPVFSQILFTGSVVDSASRAPLAYVHVGIKQKNAGTTSLADGSFAVRIGQEYASDTLTFSLVGYAPAHIPIRLLRADEPITIGLRQKTFPLGEVKITAEKRVEKKYGIKRRNRLLHFTDGMFQHGAHEGFEIAQLIKLGDTPARITSINLHVNAPRTDSASFRINFYGYGEEGPTGRILEKSIVQRHPIREGWLKFDLTAHKVALKGSFVAAIEFLPETRKNLRPIYYEVKLGGSSRSFYRRNSLGTWNRPPHHYCLYVTALVDKRVPEEAEDTETPPTLTLPSAIVKDSFDLFIRLPKTYHKAPHQRYPVVYHLDANAYFDALSHSTARLAKKKKLAPEPILVGIGYGNAFIMDSVRVRDYTFPPAPASDSLPLSGGGESFYRFIQRELIPYMDRVYRTDTTRRTLMGHSLGGYFALYALLRGRSEPALFTHYVAASPSLDYCDAYITRQFEHLPLPEKSNPPPRLYLTAGEMEVAEDPHHSFN